MYRIRVKDITKVYPLYAKPLDRLKETVLLGKKNMHADFFALDKVSFDVEEGQTVGIIGQNGSGKSTILKIITGVVTPTSGTVETNGKISSLLELGAGFNEEYTGLENIYLNGTMMGYSKEEMEKRIPEILDFADIGDYIYQPVKTYSSGMFVRLAFALAINVDPEILIVDEALSVGDVFFQTKCYKKMDEIRKHGTTVIIVTHDMNAVMWYCDKVILLDKGKYIAQGNPGDMVDRFKRILAHHEADKGPENTLEKREADSYGTGQAEIYEFGVFDRDGNETNTIKHGQDFKVMMKVRFKDKVEKPIFALTFRDTLGTDVTGTNSMFEGCEWQTPEDGDSYEITFSQVANMNPGDYYISFGCTHYVIGFLEIMHRLYDAGKITITGAGEYEGVYNMNSRIEVEEV